MRIRVKELHRCLGLLIDNPPKLSFSKAVLYPPPDFDKWSADLKTWMEAWYAAPDPMRIVHPVVARPRLGVGPEVLAFPPLKKRGEVRPYGPPGFEPRKKPRKKRKEIIKKPAPKKAAKKTKPKTKKRK